MIASGRNDSAITRGCRQYATARQNESRNRFMAPRIARGRRPISYHAVVEKILVEGVKLEVQRLPRPAGERRASIGFLHDGLGSAAMWRDWPAQVCAAA